MLLTTYKSLCPKVAVLVMVTVALINCHDENQLGKEGFLLLTAPCNSSFSEAVRARTWRRQELTQKPWMGAASWLAPHGWLSQLS